MWLRPIDPGFDRRMMQSLVLLSSSEAARQAAAAWLAAFDAARAAGAEEGEAHARAGAAWRFASEEEHTCTWHCTEEAVARAGAGQRG
jgi:hypothetical protein